MRLGVRLEEQLNDVTESHHTGVLRIYQNFVAIENKIGTRHLECLVTEIPMNHDEVMREINRAMYFRVYRKARSLQVWKCDCGYGLGAGKCCFAAAISQ